MRPPTPRNWKGESLTADLTSQATPPADGALLRQAVSWPEDVATTPYCGCAHLFDGSASAAVEQRYLAAMVAPGAVHGRAAIGRSSNNGGVIPATLYHETWSNAGGTSGNDVIRVLWVYSAGGTPSSYSWGGKSEIRVTAAESNNAPAVPMERLYELQTDDVPTVEPLFVTLASSFSLCVSEQVADLETI